MLSNKDIKKISKKFIDISEEEQWLQGMLNEGWLLASYDTEDLDICQYKFEFHDDLISKKIVYKIDYRSFNSKADYEEYKTIFEESGWTTLSKNKWYSKHIFYINDQNSNTRIFSDNESLLERERRKMMGYLVSIIMTLIMCVILVTLYSIYGRTSFIGAGLFTLIACFKFSIDYFKQWKVYKSLI